MFGNTGLFGARLGRLPNLGNLLERVAGLDHEFGHSVHVWDEGSGGSKFLGLTDSMCYERMRETSGFIPAEFHHQPNTFRHPSRSPPLVSAPVAFGDGSGDERRK